MEVWRDVEGCKGKYRISDHGNLYSLLSSKLMKQFKSKHGYMRCALHVDGKQRSVAIHRLVAVAFCEGRSKDKNIVNHKDGVKHNNVASNLEWCTQAENTLHYHKSAKAKPAINAPICQHVVEIVKLLYIHTNRSRSEIADFLGLTKRQVYSILYSRQVGFGRTHKRSDLRPSN